MKRTIRCLFPDFIAYSAKLTLIENKKDGTFTTLRCQKRHMRIEQIIMRGCVEIVYLPYADIYNNTIQIGLNKPEYELVIQTSHVDYLLQAKREYLDKLQKQLDYFIEKIK